MTTALRAWETRKHRESLGRWNRETDRKTFALRGPFCLRHTGTKKHAAVVLYTCQATMLLHAAASPAVSAAIWSTRVKMNDASNILSIIYLPEGYNSIPCCHPSFSHTFKFWARGCNWPSRKAGSSNSLF